MVDEVNADRVADAYRVIDVASHALRELVEAHLLYPQTEDARWNYLIMIDDGVGGNSISHSFETAEGVPDVPAVLVALTQAGIGTMKNSGGWLAEDFDIAKFVESEKERLGLGG